MAAPTSTTLKSGCQSVYGDVAPTLFLGSEPKFAETVSRTTVAMQRIAAKLVSDPNNSLPPEGAAAPAAWQSQFRGPGLVGDTLTSLQYDFHHV